MYIKAPTDSLFTPQTVSTLICRQIEHLSPLINYLGTSVDATVVTSRVPEKFPGFAFKDPNPDQLNLHVPSRTICRAPSGDSL